MDKLVIKEGKSVIFNGKPHLIKKVFDINWLLGEDEVSGKIARMRVSDVKPLPNEKQDDEKLNDLPFDYMEDGNWEKAKQRFEIIKPIIDDVSSYEEVSIESNTPVSTLYRWTNQYKNSGKLSSLVPLQTGGKGVARISKEAEEIIKMSIEDTYLTRQKKSVQKTCLEVLARCKKAGIEPPHVNTIRNRINQLSDYTKTKGRLGKREADLKFGPKAGYVPPMSYPLAVIQIDHTKLDVIIVDEIHRKPIGRPWITLAMDVFSRMVTGFYISMDPPGTLGTGICIANSILPKEDLLIRNNIKGEWPCWGVMETIRLDNAREFRGESLVRSCTEYNINLSWRRVARPEDGGHIERLLGTFLREIHTLPGTTFSNTKDRKGYDSEKSAVFSLSELDQWLTTFIVEVYHQRVHSTLKISPLQKYNEGILGTGEIQGVGIPPRILNGLRLKLDFLPGLERTIQDYGVLIDHIHYYSDVLRRWINATEPGSGKSRSKRKFIFKRDPRNISIVYFFDPELKDYFPVPYRDMSRPTMSLWEYNEVIIDLNKEKKVDINEEDIFDGYEKMKRIEKGAVERTMNTKKNNLKAFKREESRRIRDKDVPKIENERPIISKKQVKHEENDDTDFPEFKPTPFKKIDF